MPGHDEKLSAACRRLLLHLAGEEEAFARVTADEPGHVTLGLGPFLCVLGVMHFLETYPCPLPAHRVPP